MSPLILNNYCKVIEDEHITYLALFDLSVEKIKKSPNGGGGGSLKSLC